MHDVNNPFLDRLVPLSYIGTKPTQSRSGSVDGQDTGHFLFFSGRNGGRIKTNSYVGLMRVHTTHKSEVPPSYHEAALSAVPLFLPQL